MQTGGKERERSNRRTVETWVLLLVKKEGLLDTDVRVFAKRNQGCIAGKLLK